MKNINIVVVGIFVVDLSFKTKVFPKPGETIIGKSYLIGPGGKGSNQAVAIARSGGKPFIIARVGDDNFGEMGRKLHISEGGTAQGFIIAKGEKTGAANISIDENGMNSIVVVPGSASGLTPDMVESNLSMIKKSSIMLTGFEIPIKTAEHSLLLAKKHDLKTILNPAPFLKTEKDIWSLVDFLTPNEHEASAITGIDVKDPATASIAGKKICQMGVKTSIITLGSNGVLCTLNQNDEGLHVMPPMLSGNIIDTVGAGDVFNGAFSVAISEGMDIEKALRFSNTAAAIAVRREGAALSAPKRNEIEHIKN